MIAAVTSMRRLCQLGLCASLLAGCADEGEGRPLTGLEGLAVTQVNPEVAVEGTTLVLEGRSFIDDPIGISWLRLDGEYGGVQIDVLLPADFVDFEHLHVVLDQTSLDRLGASSGDFSGTAAVVVDYQPEATRFQSPPVATTLSIRPSLEPELEDVGSGGAVFVNDAIPVTGAGLLLSEGEGTTVAVIEGCFTPLAMSECNDIGTVEVPVVPDEPFARDRGTFAFAPSIAGILPGTFEGTVSLRNDHSGGDQSSSDALAVSYDLLETQVDNVSGAASLGQFIDIQGGGFVGEEGLTLLTLDGEYVEDDAVGGVPVEGLAIIPEFVDGRLVRYVISEDDALGDGARQRRRGSLRVRHVRRDAARGGLVSRPGVHRAAHADHVPDQPGQASGVGQVQHDLRRQPQPLRAAGARPADPRSDPRGARARLRCRSTSSFAPRSRRTSSSSPPSRSRGPIPTAWACWATTTTPGKDTNNERLFDRIGGVNATTQETGSRASGACSSTRCSRSRSTRPAVPSPTRSPRRCSTTSSTRSAPTAAARP